MNILCIINEFYPKFAGETFLANELKYYKCIDKIVLFPLAQNDSLKIFTYERLPDNCSVVSMCKFSVLNKIKYSILALFFLEFYKEIYNKKAVFNFKYIVHLFRFTAKGLFFKDEFLKSNTNLLGADNRIILYSYWGNRAAFVATAISKEIPNSITFTRLHRIDVYEDITQYGIIPYRDYVYKTLDRLFPISQDAAKYIQERYDEISSNKIEIERLGTDDYGCNYDRNRNKLVLVSCSWMRKVKRVKLICEALTYLNIPVHWIHYGSGDEYQSVKELSDKIVKTHANVSITLKGAVENKKILADFKRNKYDVFINVSENEGVPVSIMEAMSFGKIIVATDVGGTAEIVKNNVNGFLLPKQVSAIHIAKVLEKIYLMNDMAFNKMSHNSRKVWEENCSAEFNYVKFSKKIQKLHK